MTIVSWQSPDFPPNARVVCVDAVHQAKWSSCYPLRKTILERRFETLPRACMRVVLEAVLLVSIQRRGAHAGIRSKGAPCRVESSGEESRSYDSAMTWKMCEPGPSQCFG